MRRRGTVLILVAGLSAMMLSLCLAVLYRAKGLAREADAARDQAQARICLNSAMAYLCFAANRSLAPDKLTASGMRDAFRPAVRVPLVTDDPASGRLGWFRICYVESSPDTATAVDGSLTVPIYHDFIVTVGGGPSRGIKPSELPDPEVVDLQSLTYARLDEPRFWFRVRLRAPLWYHSEPFTDREGDGQADSPYRDDGSAFNPIGDPFFNTNPATNTTFDRGEVFTDLNNDGVYTSGEPFFDVNRNGLRDAAIGPVYLSDGSTARVRCWGVSRIEPLAPLSDTDNDW